MSILAYLVVAFVAIPTAIFLIQCWGAIFTSWLTRGRPIEGEADHSAAVIVPAHNEQQVISATLCSLRPQLGERGRMVVIAHNCDDETARIAREEGAEVLEVNEPDRRGKGWALAAGRDYLADNPPDVMLIVDADTTIEPGFMRQVVATAVERQRPIQGKYLLHVDGDDSDAANHVSSLAFTVKNAVRPLGMKLFGFPCLLNGSGMALPWKLAEHAPLAGGDAGEDYKLGIDLLMRGYPTYYCPQAVVRGPLPRNRQVAAVQRRRWSHSHLTFIRQELPHLLGDFFKRGRLASLGLACDLMVPPLIMLMLLQWIVIAATALLYFLGGSLIPLMIAAAVLLSFVLTLTIVVAVFESKLLSSQVLLGLPRYFFRYLPQYLSFFRKADNSWTKTPRESSAS